MAGALGVVLTGDTVPVEGRAAVPVYVDDSLPIVGPSRACVVVTGDAPKAGGPAQPVRLAPAGTPAIGPALPVYVIPGGGILDTMAYTNKVKTLSPTAYWTLAEGSGTTALDESGNGRNGTYTAVTLGQTGIGDGRTAALFVPASSSRCNVFSASLQSAFNGAECTIALWIRVSGAGVWTDGVQRRFAMFRADNSNRFILQKTTGNLLSLQYIAGGTTETVSITNSSTSWLHIAVTASKTNDQFIAYLNGAQSGATQTTLGTFAGSLAATTTVLGAADSAGGDPWSGYIAHAAIWTSALSAAQIASLATI